MSETNAPLSPVSRRENPKLGVWIFLGGEVVFFSTLIVTYLMLRLRSPADFAAAKAHLSIPLIGINTFVLILSSFMVVRSLEAIENGNRKAMRNYLIAVSVLGLLFISGQAYEWITLHSEGIWFQSTFGTPFFTLTGIHGTHVLVGVIWSIMLQFRIRSGAITQRNHLELETFGLYWHFVDVVWIVLFTLFYLI
ncbi:MAG TPA: cytochrome c oxidase subunit 3 [Anaerolineaceae bacterium]|nr:cytochrome c oxidase subunit 3 [Anaerolineaceae bacterium]